jgi:hypothetical protein
VEVDAQIKHSSRKLQNALKMQEQVSNDAERHQTKLDGLMQDLPNARQTADEAAGRLFGIYVVFLCLMFLQRPKDVHLDITLPSARPVWQNIVRCQSFASVVAPISHTEKLPPASLLFLSIKHWRHSAETTRQPPGHLHN